MRAWCAYLMGWHEPQCLDSRLLRNNEKEKKGIRCLLAPLNGDLVSPSWASGGPWVRGKKKGDRSLRFPDSGKWYLDVGSRYWTARMLHAECYQQRYSGSDDEKMGRTRFGLVGGK